MGSWTMDMSSYETEQVRDEERDIALEYQYQGWVPATALQEVRPTSQSMPTELASIDVDHFLERMYRFQR